MLHAGGYRRLGIGRGEVTVATRSERGLRPEARGVPWFMLVGDQQRALRVLLETLWRATKDLPGPGQWGVDPEPWVQSRLSGAAERDQATSRILLLGGGRGSGKTTVARSLNRLLSRRWHEGEWGGEDTAHLESLADELARSVVVLEPLSLADSPTDTNILAALLARIEARLFPALSRDRVSSIGGDSSRHEAVLDLLRLQNDVAMAWNGNLGDRKSELDPDNYAMEELRIERIRLQLRDRFAAVLRRAARDALGLEHPSMFLMIVDDLDVSPTQITDVVERLRMVNVPELAVLLVGDIEMIETTFRLHYADGFASSTSARLDSRSIGMSVQELATYTNSLARSALRKHVPLDQRVLLQYLTPQQALQVRPFFEEPAETTRMGLSTLGDKLDQALVAYLPAPSALAQGYPQALAEGAAERIPIAAQCYRMREFLCPTREGATEPELKSWYTGSWVLADSPRVAVDHWRTLEDLIEDRSGQPAGDWSSRGHRTEMYPPTCVADERYRADPRLRELYLRLAWERIDANTALWSEHAPISDAVRARVLTEGNLEALQLSVFHWVRKFDPSDPASPTKRSTETVNDQPGAQPRRVVYYTRHLDIEYGVKGTVVAPEDAGPLVAAEDLLSLQFRTAAAQATVLRHRDHLQWVVEPDPTVESVPDGSPSRRQLTDEEAARPRVAASWEDKDRARGTPWRIPRYRTLRQVEQFGHVWNLYLNAADTPTPVELAQAWIVCHTESLLGGRPLELWGVTVEGLERDPGHALTTAWSRTRPLLDWLADISKGPDSRQWDRFVQMVAMDWTSTVTSLQDRYELGAHQPPEG